jgi:AcrR family transcriptional regulator
MPAETREMLVAAAAELLDHGGPAAVTLREVGKRAGVSHNAPYKHFMSKEDLLAAIASRELSRQANAMNRAGVRATPLDALRSLMHGYVRWARAYPARFKLTFGAWSHGSAELGEAATRARAGLIEIVRAAQKRRQLGNGDPERFASLLLALAHGAADLALGGHLSSAGKGHADPEDLLDDLFRLLAESQKLETRAPTRRNSRRARKR